MRETNSPSVPPEAAGHTTVCDRQDRGARPRGSFRSPPSVRSLRLPDGADGLVSGRFHGEVVSGGPLLVVTHGAGGNLDTPGLIALARRLAERGIRVLRFNLPAAEAGRKRPDRPAVAMRAVAAVIAAAASFGGSVFVGGRSFGGRMASLLLADPETPAPRQVAGAVLLAYPLMPPGKPEVPRERVEHLGRIRVPMLFVSGDRDPFAPPALLEPVVTAAGAEVRWIAGGDHGFRVRKAAGRPAGEVQEEIAGAVAHFIAARVGEPGQTPAS